MFLRIFIFYFPILQRQLSTIPLIRSKIKWFVVVSILTWHRFVFFSRLRRRFEFFDLWTGIGYFIIWSIRSSIMYEAKQTYARHWAENRIFTNNPIAKIVPKLQTMQWTRLIDIFGVLENGWFAFIEIGFPNSWNQCVNGLMVRILPFQGRGPGSIPGWRIFPFCGSVILAFFFP